MWWDAYDERQLPKSFRDQILKVQKKQQGLYLSFYSFDTTGATFGASNERRLEKNSFIEIEFLDLSLVF